MIQEIWRDIEGYTGRYQVSNQGRVRSLERFIQDIRGNCYVKKGIILKAEKKRDGYMRVVLVDETGKLSHKYIHRLVATAFIPNPDNKPDIDHINRDKTNNSYTNLRWVTKTENMFNPLTRYVCSVCRRGIKKNKRS